MVKNELNFDVELDLDIKSDILSEVRSVEDLNIVDSTKNGDSSAETLQKETDVKNPVPNELKLSIKSKILKEIKLKPVMVLEISYMNSFTQKFEIECYPNFIVEIAGRGGGESHHQSFLY